MKIEAIGGAWLLRFLRLTIRFDVQGQPPVNHPCINAFWHRNLLILAIQRIDTNVAVMVSSSEDGEMIAGPLRYLGYVSVRGSSSRQGSQALKEMIRISRKHSLAITPDGPKGPEGTIHPGIFQIALLAKIPIIPVSVSTRHEWILKSWDRFRVPLPFSRIVVHYGAEIPVCSSADFPAAELALRKAFSDWD